MLRRLAAVAALSTVALLAFAPPAWAHVEIDPTEAVAGSTETLVFNVEYEGSATMGLEVQLPEGASVTDVPEKAGWTATIDEAAGTVVWTGGSSDDDDSFTAVVQLPTTVGEVLFPAVVQTAEGEVAWIEEAESEGEEGHPAPRLTLVADATGSSTSSTTSTTASSGDSTTTTASELPGTTLEAEQRDDGNTSAAPWVIGAGIAALAAVGIGGWILKRRQDAEKARDDAEKAQGSGGADGDGGSAGAQS